MLSKRAFRIDLAVVCGTLNVQLHVEHVPGFAECFISVLYVVGQNTFSLRDHPCTQQRMTRADLVFLPDFYVTQELQ